MTDRKTVTFHCVYPTMKGPWPIDVQFGIPPIASEVKPIMEAISDWLKNAGFSPRFVGLAPPLSGLPQPGQEGTFGAVGGAPMCPVHGAKMKISQYKAKDGKEQWYCPKMVDGEYCTERLPT